MGFNPAASIKWFTFELKDRSDGVTTLKDMRHNKEYMLKDQNGKQKDGMFLKFNKEKGAVPNIDEESNAQTPLLA